MSSLPGYTLEDYVMWNHDLIVDRDCDANQSLKIAEALGIPTNRISITQEQFAPILELYEPFRELVEHRLDEFNEETMSWRDYAGYSFDEVSDVSERAQEIVKSLRQALENSSG